MRCLEAFGERIMVRDADRRTAELQIRVALINRFGSNSTTTSRRSGTTLSADRSASPGPNADDTACGAGSASARCGGSTFLTLGRLALASRRFVGGLPNVAGCGDTGSTLFAAALASIAPGADRTTCPSPRITPFALSIWLLLA